MRQQLLKNLYIIALDTPDVPFLQLQYTPLGINISRSAKLQATAVVGRNEPLHQWTGGETQLSFTIDFFAQRADNSDVKEKVDWLLSMTYSGQETPPSRLVINMGKLFEGTTWILKDCNPNYSVFELTKDFLPRMVSVACTFVRQIDNNQFSNEIRRL